MRHARALLLSSLLATTSCGHEPPTSTRGMATSELSLQVIVEGSGDELSVRLGIYAPSHDQYQRLLLDAGEHLRLRTADAGDVELLPDGTSVPSYLGRLPSRTFSFQIDLERPTGSALGMRVELPQAFDITLPREAISLKKPYTLAWSPTSATPMTLSLKGTCLSTEERKLFTDPGSFTWSVADYHGNGEGCSVTFELKREGGSIANAPGLGPVQLFRATQLRRLTLMASP